MLLGVSAPRENDTRQSYSRLALSLTPRSSKREFNGSSSTLDRDVDGGSHAVLGLTPDLEGHWRIGTPVTVRISGTHVRTEPPARAFEWNGRENLLSFVVAVEPQAPACIIPLCFEAFIEGVSVRR